MLPIVRSQRSSRLTSRVGVSLRPRHALPHWSALRGCETPVEGTPLLLVPVLLLTVDSVVDPLWWRLFWELGNLRHFLLMALADSWSWSWGRSVVWRYSGLVGNVSTTSCSVGIAVVGPD